METRGKYHQRIDEVNISGDEWKSQHWKSFLHNYSRAKYFNVYKNIFEDLYGSDLPKRLSLVNHKFIQTICALIGINTKLSWSSDFTLIGDKNERLISLCRQAGAVRYLSGPLAKSYMDDALFETAGIRVDYFDYSGYRPYSQLHGPFVHNVSVLDLLFNEGPNASRFLLSASGQ